MSWIESAAFTWFTSMALVIDSADVAQPNYMSDQFSPGYDLEALGKVELGVPLVLSWQSVGGNGWLGDSIQNMFGSSAVLEERGVSARLVKS